MVWTAPRTWSNGEVVTAAIMNTHVRDNLAILKVTRNDLGRIIDLSSATLADLSSTNVTGLARAATDNAYTAGQSRYQGTSRIVLPVGADKYEDLGGGLRRGNWVETDYLHHIASNQTTEYRYLGEFVSTPAGAVAGSLWVEGDYLHYVDADGDERRCQSLNAASPHSDAGAQPGSVWAETYVHWIRETGTDEKPGHADIAHTDGAAHSDTHSDVGHGDSHGDTGHSDSHGDTTHDDSHGDVGHSDAAHGDAHADHVDVGHADGHGDVGHQDITHNDSHSDVSHADSHGDVSHSDSHSDSHTDSHTDHADHGDVTHVDNPVVVP